MSTKTRIWLLGMVASAIVAIAAPAAQGAFGIERFFAENCKVSTCKAASSPSEEVKQAETEGYSQAAGHPPYGITDFAIASDPTTGAPSGIVTHIRTDVAPGVSTNPQAVPMCALEQFGETEVAPGVFPPPTCEAGTIIGENNVEVAVEVAPSMFAHIPLKGTVYNLKQTTGLSSLFGVALELPTLLTKGAPGLFAHTLIEGHVEWGAEAAGTGQADFHDLFEIEVSPALPLISSRLTFKGNIGTGGFLTNPTRCVPPGPATTTTLQLEAENVTSPTTIEQAKSTFTTAIGTQECGIVPFEPAFALVPELTASDVPDGITTELSLPHDPNPANLDDSQLETATVTLPEGMTLNPSAAPGLQICTSAEIGLKTTNPVTCPDKSIVGEATLDVPGLPAGSLKGNVYLGGPDIGAITKPPYIVYVRAVSEEYGVDVRLEGEVEPDLSTGRVTARFPQKSISGLPEQPFSNLTLKFKGGATAPIANPLACGPVSASTILEPYTGTPAATPSSDPFSVTGCAVPLPFSLSQSTAATPTTGGAGTSFTLNLARADGQQYLSKVSTTLPAGLVGKIPAVPLCPEPAASQGTCPAASQIGTTTVTVGSGAEPVHFTGTAYLTGPYGKAPYGMTFVIPTAVGPFNFGNEIVRAGIEVDPYTSRVTVSSTLPTVIQGVPLRLKTLSVAINKTGFLVNPTNCGALTTNDTLTSTLGATQSIATAFQASDCSALAFKPKFTASSNGRTSRANGASLNVKVGYPTGAQANIKSVLVTVPKQLPSRLTTLKNACLEAVFNANPYACPSNSRVGGATVTTPVLPGKLTGPAYFVSHGGAAFPDLDLVLSGDGVTVILVGNTNISKGVTTSNFATLPDVPVTNFAMNLPIGKNSAVAANGNLCKQKLVMPTTITAQNGKVIKQNTPISVSGCPVTVLARHVSGGNAVVTVQVPAAGRLSGGGKGLKTVYRHPGKARKVTFSVPLSKAGRAALAAHGRLSVSVRVGFLPKKGKSSSARTTVVFK